MRNVDGDHKDPLAVPPMQPPAFALLVSAIHTQWPSAVLTLHMATALVAGGGDQICSFVCTEQGVHPLECREWAAFVPALAARPDFQAFETLVMEALRDPMPYFKKQPKLPTLLACLPTEMLILGQPADEYTQKNKIALGRGDTQVAMLCLWAGKDGLTSLSQEDEKLLILLTSQYSLWLEMYKGLAQYSKAASHLRHDLRTPLTSVSMIGGLLTSEEPLGQDEQIDLGDMLESAARKMQALLTAFKLNNTWLPEWLSSKNNP